MTQCMPPASRPKSTQVQACWEIRSHIVEFEQAGETRAAYGQKLLPKPAEHLTREFGKGFDERNLRHMRAFYQGFPIWNAVRSESSWMRRHPMPRATCSDEIDVWEARS